MGMTKEQALKDFKKHVIPEIIKRYGEDDVVAMRTAWVNYTDDLHRSGMISDNQVNSWDNPFS